jgi:Ca2+/Na+ antiporter
MTSGGWLVLFVLGVVVSLGSSWLLVSRLERLGERAGLSEALRVVWLSGTVAVWVAAGCLLAVLGLVSPLAGLLLVAAVLVAYVALLGLRRERLRALPLPASWTRWLAAAVHEEETELEEAIRPRRGTWRDGAVAAVMLVAVVAASTVMERAATALGGHFGVADIVTGAVVLAVVTSLPNAVAAVYLAARGRGAAALSTALNSNALNVAAGLLLPAAITGLGARSGQDVLVAAWYAGLTAVTLLLAYRGRGLSRLPGTLIIAGYLVSVAALLAAVAQGRVTVLTAALPAAVVAVPCTVLLALRPGPAAGRVARAPAVPGPRGGRAQAAALVPGWSAARLWRVSVLLCLAVAALDAATGRHLILIGLLAAGPVTAVATGLAAHRADWCAGTRPGHAARGAGRGVRHRSPVCLPGRDRRGRSVRHGRGRADRTLRGPLPLDSAVRAGLIPANPGSAARSRLACPRLVIGSPGMCSC